MKSIVFLAAVLLLLAQAAGGQDDSTSYTDPARAFSLKIPRGWQVERDKNNESTLISSDRYSAKLLIWAGKVPSMKKDADELKNLKLVESSKPLFEGWLNGLKEQARVTHGKIYKTQIKGFDALRLDVTYYRGDANDPRKGYALYILGAETACFVSLTGDESGFNELEKIFSTWRLEP